MWLNLSACGETLAEVEKNLRAAIELYLEDIKQYPETVVSPVSSGELIEFLTDTQPEWYENPLSGGVGVGNSVVCKNPQVIEQLR